MKESKATAEEEQEEKKLLVGVAMSTVAIGIADDRGGRESIPQATKRSPPRAFFLPSRCRSSSSVLSALHGLRCAPLGPCYLLGRYLPTFLHTYLPTYPLRSID